MFGLEIDIGSLDCHSETLKHLRLVPLERELGPDTLAAHHYICENLSQLEYVALPLPQPDLYGDVRDGVFGAYLVCVCCFPCFGPSIFDKHALIDV